jgi:CheY-like chemotaxis protein
MSEQESAVPVEIDEGDTRPVNLAAKILVVDDQEANLVATRAALEPLSRAVVTASSGAEALAYLLDHEFALALIDVGMPGMDGYELASMLRRDARFAELRLIAVTGYGQAEDRQRAARVGFDAHLVKPVEIEQVARVLGDLLEAKG